MGNTSGIERLKVLHIGKYFSPFKGGMETFLRELIERQKNVLSSVGVLAHAHEKRTTFQIYRGYMVVRASILITFMYAPISISFPFLLHQSIRRQDPDIIHFHMPNLSAFWALFVPSARKKKWVIHWHADVIFPKTSLTIEVSKKIYSFFEAKMLRRSARIIVTSPEYLNNSNILTSMRDKVQIIPLGIGDPGTEGLGRGVTKSRWPEKGFRLLSIGRLSHYKGFRFLIEAVGNIDGLVAFIVGKGEERGALQNLIKENGLTEKVFLLGEIEDCEVDRLLREADVFCLPSIEKTEAFGMVLLEAMARVKPCIVTDVAGSGMSWVVEHKKTGLVAKARDIASLEYAIRSLMDDSDLRASMGDNSRRRYEEMFEIGNIMEQINDEYIAVMDGM